MSKTIQFIQVGMVMIGALVIGAGAPRNSLAQDPRPPGFFDLGVSAARAPSLAAADAASNFIRDNVPFGTVLMPAAQAPTAFPALQIGDVLVTRHSNKTQGWGYYRHVGIYVGNSTVIEGGYVDNPDKASVLRDGRVVSTNSAEFINRYDTVCVYRLSSNSKTLGPAMAKHASTTLLGKTMTCADVIRGSYNKATGGYALWPTPTAIANSSAFTYIGGKSP